MRHKNNLGKVPPQAIEMEEAVLGAVMLEKDAINSVASILVPDSFYKDSNRLIYSAILDLFSENEPIDIITVTGRLRKKGKLEQAGGAYNVTEMTSKVASAANVEYHARIISEMYIKREIIRLSSESIQHAYDDTTDCFDVLGDLENGIGNINSGITSTSVRSAYSFIEQVEKEIVLAESSPEGITGIPSGIPCIDKITGGWQDTDLIIIAARPAMAKTDLGLNIGLNASKAGFPTAFFSLEMGDMQLVKRTVAIDCKIDREKIKSGKLSDEDWMNFSKLDKNTFEGFLIVDDPALSIYGLRAKLRRLVSKYGIKMAIVDYLQLITSTIKGSKNDQISEISRTLKTIAMELKIPIIAISQLSRAVETRGGDKRPMLSDLRDSGAIEQDANIVIFPYRPIYYGIENRDDIGDTSQLMELNFAKNRNGAVDTVDCRYLAKYGKVIDFKYHDIDPPLEPINDHFYSNNFKQKTTDF